MKTDWYHDFVNTRYKPRKNDVKALFYYEPAGGLSRKDAVGRIASESSSGTWTTLTRLPRLLPRVKAYVYNYTNNYARIAYPGIDFEPGSVPGLMSAIAGNIFGMKALKNLRLIDAELPIDYVKKFKGPYYGSSAIKKIFKKKHGPITAVVPKPKIGYTSKEHAEIVARQVWTGGIDCVKDDENLTDQKFNRFSDRVKYLAKVRDQIEKQTGDIKDAFINITSPDFKEMEKRIKLIHDHGFRYFMIDVVISGFTAVETASEIAWDYKMAMHGHRAMHAMYTKNPKQGMSMLFLAKIMRLLGVDQLHTGTVIGKLAGNKEEILAMEKMLMKQEVAEIKNLRMHQNFGRMRDVLPVSSGGLHPGILDQIFDMYGTTDIGIQIGGGTQGHPDGIEAGAIAVMQAIDAYKQNVNVKEYAKNHKELAHALKKWGTKRPI